MRSAPNPCSTAPCRWSRARRPRLRITLHIRRRHQSLRQPPNLQHRPRPAKRLSIMRRWAMPRRRLKQPSLPCRAWTTRRWGTARPRVHLQRPKRRRSRCRAWITVRWHSPLRPTPPARPRLRCRGWTIRRWATVRPHPLRQKLACNRWRAWTTVRWDMGLSHQRSRAPRFLR